MSDVGARQPAVHQSDDTYSAPATLRGFFTTGVARATVYDTNNVPNACSTTSTAGRLHHLHTKVDGRAAELHRHPRLAAASTI